MMLTKSHYQEKVAEGYAGLLSEREWALAAEWYMCYVLRPYINHRKTYKPGIDEAIKLCQYWYILTRRTYLSVMKILATGMSLQDA